MIEGLSSTLRDFHLLVATSAPTWQHCLPPGAPRDTQSCVAELASLLQELSDTQVRAAHGKGAVLIQTEVTGEEMVDQPEHEFARFVSSLVGCCSQVATNSWPPFSLPLCPSFSCVSTQASLHHLLHPLGPSSSPPLLPPSTLHLLSSHFTMVERAHTRLTAWAQWSKHGPRTHPPTPSQLSGEDARVSARAGEAGELLWVPGWPTVRDAFEKVRGDEATGLTAVQCTPSEHHVVHQCHALKGSEPHRQFSVFAFCSPVPLQGLSLFSLPLPLLAPFLPDCRSQPFTMSSDPKLPPGIARLSLSSWQLAPAIRIPWALSLLLPQR